jgi:ABC-type antimicrobial peptide transport system permease subunit
MDLNVARQVLVKTFIVRTSHTASFAELRAAVREIDPTAAFSSARTVEEYAASQLQELRQSTALLTMFGTISALLSGIGIFGIMAQTVMQRRNEIGIRVALGASASNVLGVAAAFATTRVIQTFLWGIEPTDPVTFAIVTAALAVLAPVACCVPARRALKIDPIVALRLE